MFAGPIIAREVLTAPRPLRFYVARASYVGLMFVLMWTAWQSIVGWRDVQELGLIARFGGILFQVFVLIQLTLMLFFAPLAAATAVAHEKDRRTFVLLLMTDLRDVEIVVGKLAASLLQIVTLLLTGAPVLFLCLLLGGMSPVQILDVLGITAAAGVAGGSLGLLVALWRDRTFQSLALTVLALVLALAAVEAVGVLFPGLAIAGVPFAEALNPYRAVIAVLNPSTPLTTLSAASLRPSLIFIAAALAVAAAQIAFGIFKLRDWNPGKHEPREQREGEAEVVEQLIEVSEEEAAAQLVGVAAGGSGTSGPALGGRFPGLGSGSGNGSGRGDGDGRAGLDGDTEADDRGSVDFRERATLRRERGDSTGLHVPRRTHRRITRGAQPYRRPWTNPIIWRELRTRAYGTKPLIIKGAYALIFGLGVSLFYYLAGDAGPAAGLNSGLALIPAALAILSLLLVNAQGVTALTSERDTGALDLLLVTELSPREFIYGKLYGVLYNTKEMLALPVGLAAWFAATGALSAESAFYAVVDFLLLAHFSAMLGLHAAITYTNSRTAVANSLGTIFFLMVGILVCTFLILISRQEFGRQLLSFLIFIGAGSVALFGSLGAKNPSHAIALVSLLTPFWSFYCIISLLRGDILAAFLFSVGIYGFALLAMLVPAVSDFDIALGRTSAIQG